MAKGSAANEVISMGPWSGDKTQQMVQRHAVVQMFVRAGVTQFTSRRVDAVGWAKYHGHQAYSIPGVPGAHGGGDKLMYAVADPGKIGGGSGSGGAGTGGTMGGSGGQAAGAAAAAVQAGMPSYTGGGPSFSIGNVTESIILQQRDDEFLGVDTLTPAEKLAVGYSPDAVNWDGFARIGSRCVRRGCAQFEDDHASLGKNAALRGVSLALIPNGTNDQLQMLYSFADNAIGGVRSSVATDITVVTTAPRWGKPVALKGWVGPQLTLTDNGSQEIQVDLSYANRFANGQAGLRANSVVGVTVRYSTVGYPRDIDGFDYLHDKGTPSSTFTNYDRAAWKGAAAVITQTLVAGKIYVTAWALTREGISEPSFSTLTLA